MKAVNAVKGCCQSLCTQLSNYTIGFLLLVATSAIMMILSSLFQNMGQYLRNTPILVIQKFEYWRLMSSFLFNISSVPWSIIVFLLCLWVLKISMIELQTKLSTVYILVELVKQTIVINILFDLFFYPLIYLTLVNGIAIGTYGLMIPMMNFLMQDVCLNPNASFTIFGLTCFLKKKYLPIIVMLGLLSIQAMDIWSFFFINTVIMLQHMCKKRPIFAFPLSFYLKINQWIPQSIRNTRGYVDAQHVKDILVEYCEEWTEKHERQLKKVEQKRKQLHSTHQDKYKHHWINKAAEFSAQKEDIQYYDEGKEEEVKEEYFETPRPKEEEKDEQCLTSRVEEEDAKQDVVQVQNYRSTWAKKAEQLEKQQEKITFESEIIKPPKVNFPPPKEHQPLPSISYDNLNVQPEIVQESNMQEEIQMDLPPQGEQKTSKQVPKIDNPPKAAAAIDDEQQWY